MSISPAAWDRLSRLENPVALKEMRGRMRDGKAFLLVAAYVLVLGITLYMVIASSWDTRGGAVSVDRSAQIGRDTFMAVSMLQLALVCLLAPALTSGTVTLEREQQTLDLLRMTRLTSVEILLGKLVSSLSYVLLLIAASVPVSSLCFLLGGVSPGEMATAYLLTFTVGLLSGALGLFWSVVSRKTSVAGALAYGSLFFLLLGVPVYAAFVESLYTMGGSQPVGLAGLALNHAIALIGIIAVLAGFAVAILLRALLARTGWKRAGRAAAVLAGGIALALFVVGTRELLRHPNWQPPSMQFMLAPHPFSVMYSIVTEMDASGPLPQGMLDRLDLYWYGMMGIYLIAAVDVLAWSVLRFDRLRARA
ncbi:MAG: ABC transporter permease [Armatimonadetes bacterium]|nr:ABC transporter permease [Armatimonadota bacterium]